MIVMDVGLKITIRLRSTKGFYIKTSGFGLENTQWTSSDVTTKFQRQAVAV